MKVLFFDVGYTLVNEDAVWEKRCREQAQTDEAKKLGLSADDIYHEIEIATVSRKVSGHENCMDKTGFWSTSKTAVKIRGTGLYYK